MFSHLICGVSNLQEDQEHEHDHQAWSSPGSTPRKSRGRNSLCSKRNNKVDTKNNPYAMRGLDKFSALLAELEEKRQKIYSQTDSDDICFVRFKYSNSNDCVPVVVRLKKKKKNNNKIVTDETKVGDDDVKDENKPTASGDENIYSESLGRFSGEQNADSESQKKSIENKRKVTWRSIIKSYQWRRPRNYVPAVLILILFWLTLFGRSFAVLCTCFWWYMVPTIQGCSPDQSSTKKKKKKKKKKKIMIKKEYLRSLSYDDDQKKMVIGGGVLQSSSPIKNSSNSGKDDDPKCYKAPNKQHGHKKSW